MDNKSYTVGLVFFCSEDTGVASLTIRNGV